ncbi:hypothetical protein ZWY2020_015074 [Hordeum vulgare]|nr:hypothetical protein ZWY2020_015074 [Hordeum vulgare]
MNLATREAAMHVKVPGYEVPLDLLDSRGPAARDKVEELPGPDFNATLILKLFESRGFDKTDVLALYGAHTIGRSSVKYHFGKNAEFVRELQHSCAKDPNRLYVTTPNEFDNKYYNNLIEGKGVPTWRSYVTHTSEGCSTVLRGTKSGSFPSSAPP